MRTKENTDTLSNTRGSRQTRSNIFIDQQTMPIHERLHRDGFKKS